MIPYPSFGEIDTGHSQYSQSRVVILPIPYEKTTTYVQGTKNAPAAILKASTNLELYDEELQIETFRIGIHTFPPMKIENFEPSKVIQEIEARVATILIDGKFPVIIGGEHTVTIGAVRAIHHRYPSLKVLQLDAHADLREDYMGDPFNHACTMARVREICPVIQVGIRSISLEEIMLVRAKGWKIFFFHEMEKRGNWVNEVMENLEGPIYITIDMDFFNPSEVPAVGTPEPGGMGWSEATKFLREVIEKRNVIGFDLVELCPQRDSIRSEFFAAKLIYRLIGYRFASEINPYCRLPIH
jgi:agmatinase